LQGDSDQLSSAVDASSSDTAMEVDSEATNHMLPTALQLKYIKPLLGASSRLGRALAELFGLLVKVR
jgi:E3 ubiquitin-protein ligase HUWE1